MNDHDRDIARARLFHDGFVSARKFPVGSPFRDALISIAIINWPGATHHCERVVAELALRERGMI